jgi:O-antigen/teichoic acid export membrane protein
VSEANARRRLLLSAFTNWLAFAATLLVAFFLTPYLVGKLSDGPYGVWLFVESILAYLTLFDLGIAACVVRFVARYHAQRHQREINKLASSCLALFIGLGTIAFALGAVLAPLFVAGVAAKAGLETAEATGFLLLMLANLAVTLPLSVFPSILDGLERFASKSAIRIVFLAIRTAGTIVLMERSPSLFMLGVLYTACNVLEHATLAALSFRFLPSLHLSWRFVDRPTLKVVKGYSLDAFLAMFAGRVSVQSGYIIVGIFINAAAVTSFGLALRLVEFAKALLRSATNTLTPAVSSLEANGDLAAIRRIFLHSTRWVLYLILPVHIGLVIFGRPFLTIWVGPEYAERCYPPLVILSATLSLVIAQSVAARILYGMGRLRLFARMTLLEAAINLTLSLLLAGELGIEGVALAAALPNLAFCMFAIGYTARLLAVKWRAYFSSSWLKPLAVASVPALVWLGLDVPIRGWADFGSALLAGLAPYVLIVLSAEGQLNNAWTRLKKLFRSISRRQFNSSTAAR